MKTDTQSDLLLSQQLALSVYLEALLHEDTRAAFAPGTDGPLENDNPPVAGGAEAAQLATPCTDTSLPDWAETRFQVLLFEVAGLTLAVPLTSLKGVVSNTEGVTPMPGHSPLFLGVVPYQGIQSKVVDTARFVLPPDRTGQSGDQVQERSSHLVMIDEGRWALACSRIGDVIELDRTDVKWRTTNGKRAWLAGTVIERMCALLDVDELTRQLVEGMPGAA